MGITFKTSKKFWNERYDTSCEDNCRCRRFFRIYMRKHTTLFRDGGKKQQISNGGRFKSAVAARDKKQTMTDLREVSSNCFKNRISKKVQGKTTLHTPLCFTGIRPQSIQSARLSFQSSPPPPARECCSPPLGPRGETHSLAGWGGGGDNSDEGTDTLALFVYVL